MLKIIKLVTLPAFACVLCLFTAIYGGTQNASATVPEASDEGFAVTATYDGSAGTLGINGTAGTVSVSAVSDDDTGVYGYKATGTAYYQGWKTEFTYDYPINITENVSILLEPNYESSGDGSAHNESSRCRKVHIEMAGSTGAVAWNLFAPWAGGTPDRIRFSGTGTSLKDTETFQEYVKAFYKGYNSGYYFKVEIIPNGTESKLVFSAVDKTTLTVVGSVFEHYFTMPVFSGETKLFVSYYDTYSDTDISEVPERDLATDLDFGVYNFRNGKIATLIANDVTGKAGDTVSADITVKTFDGIKEAVSVTLESLNESVVTVNGTEMVFAEDVIYGNAEIKVYADGKYVATFNATVPVENLTVANKNEITALKIGESKKLALSLPLDPETDDGLTFYSSDENVATVDAAGKVTVIARGTATISVLFGGTVYDSVELDIKTRELVTEQDSADIDLNGKCSFRISADLSGAELTVTVTDAEIAEITESRWIEGVYLVRVKGLKTGETEITVGCEDNAELFLTLTVTVSIKSVAFTVTEKTMEIDETFSLTHTPSEIALSYTTSDDSVVTVSEDGTVTAVGAGTATVRGVNGELSATITVTVLSPEITVTAESVSVAMGKTVRAPVETAQGSVVIYATSNPRIFTVSDDGVITGVREGTAQLVIKSGSKTVTVSVTVTGATGCGGALSPTCQIALLFAAVFLGIVIFRDKRKKEE